MVSSRNVHISHSLYVNRDWMTQTMKNQRNRNRSIEGDGREDNKIYEIIKQNTHFMANQFGRAIMEWGGQCHWISFVAPSFSPILFCFFILFVVYIFVYMWIIITLTMAINVTVVHQIESTSCGRFARLPPIVRLSVRSFVCSRWHWSWLLSLSLHRSIRFDLIDWPLQCEPNNYFLSNHKKRKQKQTVISLHFATYFTITFDFKLIVGICLAFAASK